MFDWLFSFGYAHPFERRVNRFFRGLKSGASESSVRRDLLKLMKEDFVVLNMWMEYRFRGYKSLSRRKRRGFYRRRDEIVAAFLVFVGDEKVGRREFLVRISEFLSGRYSYIKTASFWRLFGRKMEGDCNQVVSLYVYLYSLRFDIADLKIKLLPGHVCLHFDGEDLEATNGSFVNYKEFVDVLPITELVSTNLLDVSDFRESARVISPRVMLKSAQLAYKISSFKGLVAKNLEVIYRNLVASSLETKDFRAAEFYADRVEDSDVMVLVKRAKGADLFKRGRFEKAAEIFKGIGDKENEKVCYSRMYNVLAKKVSEVNLKSEARRFRSTYKKMYELAKRIEDRKLIDSVKRVLKDL